MSRSLPGQIKEHSQGERYRLADQGGLLGPVASVPTCWRALDEIAAGGGPGAGADYAAVNAARRQARAGIEARHDAIPGIALTDRTLEGVTGLRLDATVVVCHSDKQGAEPDFKGKIKTHHTAWRPPHSSNRSA